MFGASPAQPQITVARDEFEDEDAEAEEDAEEDEEEEKDADNGGDDGASIWDVPKSPAPRETQRRGRSSVRSARHKPVARFQKDVALGTHVDNPVRVAEGANDHLSDDDEGGDFNQRYRGRARRGQGRSRRHGRGFDGRGEAAEPNTQTASRRFGVHEAHEQGASMPYTSAEDGDAEGELWGEPMAPVAPMGTAGPMDDAVDVGPPCDEAKSADMTTGMEDDAWMHSAIMDFGDMAGIPGAQHWGDMLEFDADNVGMHMDVDLDMGADIGMDMDMNMDMNFMDQFDNGHLSLGMMGVPSAVPEAVPAVSTEARENQDDLGLVQGDGGDANVDVDSDVAAAAAATAADADNDAVKLLQPSATTAGRSRAPSILEPTTSAVKDGEQPGRLAGNHLLAVIAKALSQMDSYGVAEPEVNNKAYWPMESQGMSGMPFAMTAC